MVKYNITLVGKSKMIIYIFQNTTAIEMKYVVHLKLISKWINHLFHNISLWNIRLLTFASESELIYYTNTNWILFVIHNKLPLLYGNSAIKVSFVSMLVMERDFKHPIHTAMLSVIQLCIQYSRLFDVSHDVQKSNT